MKSYKKNKKKKNEMWRESQSSKCSVAADWFSNKRDPVETSSIGGSRPSTKLCAAALPLTPETSRAERDPPAALGGWGGSYSLSPGLN